MFDYAGWFHRAEQFVLQLPPLHGSVTVEGKLLPPLSDSEFDQLAAASRLPIPQSLRDMWTTGSAHCGLSYLLYGIPDEQQQQVSLAGGHGIHLWGGPTFLAASETVQLTHDLPTWAEAMRTVSPRDARIWDNSIYLISVGNGNLIGLFVQEDLIDPPVVYRSHDEVGGSYILANSLSEFLRVWEKLSYIGIDFLKNFCDPDTELLDVSRFPVEVEGLTALMKGEVRNELVKSSLVRSEEEWLTARNPSRLFRWMDEQGMKDRRREQLFACACCHRVWNLLDESERDFVDRAQLLAEQRLKEEDLRIAKRELHRRLPEFQLKRSPEISQKEFELRELTQWLISSAVSGMWTATLEITNRLDEPEASAEKHAHADLVRHIFGNPFRRHPLPEINDATVRQLAEQLASGQPVSEQLSTTLFELGATELAEHFQSSFHPAGCWALDWLLGIRS